MYKKISFFMSKDNKVTSPENKLDIVKSRRKVGEIIHETIDEALNLQDLIHSVQTHHEFEKLSDNEIAIFIELKDICRKAQVEHLSQNTEQYYISNIECFVTKGASPTIENIENILSFYNYMRKEINKIEDEKLELYMKLYKAPNISKEFTVTLHKMKRQFVKLGSQLNQLEIYLENLECKT